MKLIIIALILMWISGCCAGIVIGEKRIEKKYHGKILEAIIKIAEAFCYHKHPIGDPKQQ